MRLVLAAFLVSAFGFAGEEQTIAKLIQDEFSDARFEVVCLSAVDPKVGNGQIRVMTVDSKVKPAAEASRPSEFQVNSWWIDGISTGKPVFRMGTAGNILQLTKAALPTEGGDQKSFVTWLLQENSPRSNPLNYRVWVLDQVVDQNGKESVVGRSVHTTTSHVAEAVVACPVFKLK